MNPSSDICAHIIMPNTHCLTIPENDPVVAVQSLFLKVTTLKRDNMRFDRELSMTSEFRETKVFSGSFILFELLHSKLLEKELHN